MTRFLRMGVLFLTPQDSLGEKDFIHFLSSRKEEIVSSFWTYYLGGKHLILYLYHKNSRVTANVTEASVISKLFWMLNMLCTLFNNSGSILKLAWFSQNLCKGGWVAGKRLAKGFNALQPQLMNTATCHRASSGWGSRGELSFSHFHSFYVLEVVYMDIT